MIMAILISNMMNNMLCVFMIRSITFVISIIIIVLIFCNPKIKTEK